MNEITRIHLAKVPYEIEITAKRQLDTYLKTLSSYTDDREMINDIQIRMTEILAESGVKSDGVISLDDVKALRSQIGEPQEIIDESDVVFVDNATPKKLYRNLDDAMAGGVVSGLATYFKVDTTLARFIFLIITVFSSGVTLLLYAIAWFLIPPARTVADKLRLHGKPVTLATLAEANEQLVDESAAETKRQRDSLLRRSLLYFVGFFAVMGAILSIATMILAIFPLADSGWAELASNNGIMYYAAFGLAELSGLLLATLFSLIAYACFSGDFSKKIILSVVTVTVAGMIAFSSAVGIMMVGWTQQSQWVESNVKHISKELPEGFSKVNSVEFENELNGQIKYIVSYKTGYELTTLVDLVDTKPEITVQGKTAKVSLKGEIAPAGGISYPELTIYGPSLATFTVLSGDVSYTADSQANLKVDVRTTAAVTLIGKIQNLESAVAKEASLTASDASVGDSNVELIESASAEFGNIRRLTLSHDDTCPAYVDEKASLEVGSVASGMISVNGKPRPAKSYETPCFELEMTDGEDY